MSSAQQAVRPPPWLRDGLPAIPDDLRPSVATMPQPLASKVSANPGLSFYATGGFRERPLLAVAFAAVVEEFAVCETCLAELYLALRATDPDAAAGDLQEKINFSQRIDMVRAESSGLPKEQEAIVAAVADRAQTAARLRNRVVHATWGYAPALGDAVHASPTKKLLDELQQRLRGRLGLPTSYTNAEDGVMVYKASDFASIRTVVDEASAALQLLTNYVLADNVGAQSMLLDMLLSDPQTQRRYEAQLGG